MYFVTGGAFNGKSKWVKAYTQLNEQKNYWYSAYNHDLFPEKVDEAFEGYVVLEGIEQWVRGWLKDVHAEDVRKKWQAVLNQWQNWESHNRERKVIFIGSDITKGIVPIEPDDRVWRDVTGRVFQDTASKCERVELIWYGMNRRLK